MRPTRRGSSAQTLFRQNRLAQRIIRARGRIGLGIEVEPEPRLDDGVDIEDAEFAAKLHEIERGCIDGKIDAKALPAAFRQQPCQQLAIVFARDGLLDELVAARIHQRPVVIRRIDDRQPRLVEAEMALDQRQRAATDGAKPDHDDRSGDGVVDGVTGHRKAYSCEF
jgi:hypothetical protein